MTKHVITPYANLFLIFSLICILVMNTFYSDYVQRVQRWLDRFVWTDYCALEMICWVPSQICQFESVYQYILKDFKKSNTRKMLLRINTLIKYFLLLFKNDVKH